MSPVADKRRYLSVSEYAHELRVSKAAVYRSIEAGHLPAIRLQPLGALRIPASALDPQASPIHLGEGRATSGSPLFLARCGAGFGGWV